MHQPSAADPANDPYQYECELHARPAVSDRFGRCLQARRRLEQERLSFGCLNGPLRGLLRRDR